MAKKDDNNILFVVAAIIGLIVLMTQCQKPEPATIIYQTIQGEEVQPAQTPQQQPMTCQQESISKSMDGFANVEANQCMNHANIECQQLGQVLSGWSISSTAVNCCMYQCDAAEEQPVQPQQQTCTDSDGGQDDQHLILGTVTLGDGTKYTDYCWGDGRLAELYCDNGEAKMDVMWCPVEGGVCINGVCDLLPCEQIMNADEASDCEGHPTSDGGVCSYWVMNGNGMCLSSFS